MTAALERNVVAELRAAIEMAVGYETPWTNTGDGCLYVIEIGDDRMKVGWSRGPERRLEDHRSMAKALGVSTGRAWITPRRASTIAETALINFCAARATEQVRREYFRDVPFEVATQAAGELTGHTLDTLSYHVRRRSPNSKWGLLCLARFLSTTIDAVRRLVASSALEALAYELDDLPDELITVTRRSLLNWLDTEPDLTALPWGDHS